MPGFMKDVGHAMAALLIQVENGQLIFAVRSVLLSKRVAAAYAQNPIVHSCEYVPNLSSLGLCGQ
jgi:hypothetical protein